MTQAINSGGRSCTAGCLVPIVLILLIFALIKHLWM